VRAALVVVVLASAVAAAAASPGELSLDHAGIACDGCHVGSSGLDDGKCLACHRNVDPKAGMHEAFVRRALRCATCHADHRGPTYDLRGWDALPPGETRFDHAKAGWPLVTGHTRYTCADCHEQTDAEGLRRYLGLGGLIGADRTVDCRGCHAHENVHDGKWKTAQCLSCHFSGSDKPRRLEEIFHGLNSDFPLARDHRWVACAACHRARNDYGQIRFGHLDPACASCHPPLAAEASPRRCRGCHADRTP
jgi:hypothetical protein